MAIQETSQDIIHLRNLHLSAVIGLDAWDRPDHSQPIVLSVQLFMNRSPAGESDDIKDTFSYGQMCKELMSKAKEIPYTRLDHLAYTLGGLCDSWPGNMMKMQLKAPKLLLRAEDGLTKEFTWIPGPGHRVQNHSWFIAGLRIACIIGVNPHERLQKQTVKINIRIVGAGDIDAYKKQLMESKGTWSPLVRRICEVSEPTSAVSNFVLSCLLIIRRLPLFRSRKPLRSKHWKRSLR